MVRSHIEALRSRLGPPAYDRALGTLRDAEQDELRLVTPLSWVYIATLERLYGVCAPHLGTTIEALHTEVASEVVGQAVTTIWRALLKLASDSALLSRSPVIFKKAYQQGRLEVVASAAGRAELAVRDWPDMSEFALRGFRVGLESTLRAAGRRNAHGVASRTPDGATLTLHWTA